MGRLDDSTLVLGQGLLSPATGKRLCPSGRYPILGLQMGQNPVPVLANSHTLRRIGLPKRPEAPRVTSACIARNLKKTLDDHLRAQSGRTPIRYSRPQRPAPLRNLPDGQFGLLGQSRHLVEEPPMAALHKIRDMPLGLIESDGSSRRRRLCARCLRERLAGGAELRFPEEAYSPGKRWQR